MAQLWIQCSSQAYIRLRGQRLLSGHTRFQPCLARSIDQCVIGYDSHQEEDHQGDASHDNTELKASHIFIALIVCFPVLLFAIVLALVQRFLQLLYLLFACTCLICHCQGLRGKRFPCKDKSSQIGNFRRRSISAYELCEEKVCDEFYMVEPSAGGATLNVLKAATNGVVGSGTSDSESWNFRREISAY